MRYIAVERRGPHLWITFDRPDKLNVLHAEDLPGLLDVIVNLDPGVRGLVFTGAGTKAFSAGMNIEAFIRLDQASAKAFIGQLARIMRAIRRAPVVTLAAVSGYCLGGAFELALACDLRVVTTTAAFGLPEIKVGVPSVIDAALLPGFVGLSKAREMILTGDAYTARRTAAAQHRQRRHRAGPARRGHRAPARADRDAYPHGHRRPAPALRPVAQPAARRGGGAEHGRVRGNVRPQETRDQIASHYRRITGRVPVHDQTRTVHLFLAVEEGVEHRGQLAGVETLASCADLRCRPPAEAEVVLLFVIQAQ